MINVLPLFRPVSKGATRLLLAGSSAASRELEDLPNEQQHLPAPAAPRALACGDIEPSDNGFIRKGSGGSLQDNGFIRKGSGQENGFIRKGSGQDNGFIRKGSGGSLSPGLEQPQQMWAQWQPSQAGSSASPAPSSPAAPSGLAAASGAAQNMGTSYGMPMFWPVYWPTQCVVFGPKGYNCFGVEWPVGPADQDQVASVGSQGAVSCGEEGVGGGVAAEKGLSFANAAEWATTTTGSRPSSSATQEISESWADASESAAAIEEASAALASTAGSIVGLGQGRTGASRRQRRRRHGASAGPGAPLPAEVAEMKRAVENNVRARGVAAAPVPMPRLPPLAPQMAATPSTPLASLTQAHWHIEPASEGETRDGRCASPSQLWPATPESTPPPSPRSGWGLMAASSGATFMPTCLAAAAACSGNAFGAALAPGGDVPGSDDDILAQLNGSDPRVRQRVMDWVVRSAWPMAATPSGCRVVQKVVEIAEAPERRLIADQLRGRVQEAVASPHANHVLQKCIALMPPEQLAFVPAELAGSAATLARHRYGCRVLERLIEHFPPSQVEGLVSEVVEGSEKLCRHAFGNFVVQHILEHGSRSQQKQVVDVLRADAVRLAKHRVASHVVKAALLRCGQDERASLAMALSADAGELSELTHHHCGSFVVRELRRVGGVAGGASADN